MSHSKRVTAIQLIGFVATAAAVFPVAGLVFGLAGMDSGQPAAAWFFPAFVATALLAASWIALRWERAGLDSLGLVPTRRRVKEFWIGFAAASAVFAIVALVRAASVGAEWAFDPASGARAALVGLPLAFVLVIAEELLFRGYAFRKAEVLWGAPVALVGSSLLFGAYHVLGSGFWGAGAIFLFSMPALGGIVFGLAAIRTGGLALPIGLHLGGNWIGGSVLGLGLPEGSALWTASVDATQATWLMAPDVLPRLPYLLGVALLLVAVRLWPSSPRRLDS